MTESVCRALLTNGHSPSILADEGDQPLSDNAANAAAAPCAPILDDAEADSRMMLLAQLQATLTGLGVRCVLARRHRLVLRYDDPPPLAPSGPISPTLHVFAPDGTRVVTTDGAVYRLDSGQEFPASAPDKAAACISE
jgi:hypothetical protein